MPVQSITMFIIGKLGKLFLSYRYSVVYNFILWVASKVKGVFEKSIIRNHIVNKTRFEGLYETSVFYRIFEKTLLWLLKFFEKPFRWLCKITEGSIIHCCCRNAKLRFEYICGFLFLIMLIVPHDYWNNLYAVIMAVFLAVLYLGAYYSGREFALNPRALTVSLIAFVISVVCGVAMTPQLFDGARIALFFIASIVFMLVVWGSLSDEKSLKVVVSFLIGALVLICMYAIYQNYVGVPVDESLTDVKVNQGMPGRVYATLSNPNNFAEVIVLIVPFIYAMFITSDNKRTRTMLLAAFAICMIALAMTYSRSCYVAFAITTVVFVLIYDWRFILPLGILALICVPFLPESVMNRIFTIGSLADSSNSYRTYVWDGAMKLIRAVGVSGIGIGPAAFSNLYPWFANRNALVALHSHMLYMELFIELGIVGFTGFMGFMYFAAKKGLAAVNRSNKTMRCMIIAGISAFAGISFTACVEYIWFYPRVMFVFWIVLGLLLASVRISKKTKYTE